MVAVMASSDDSGGKVQMEMHNFDSVQTDDVGGSETTASGC